MSGTPYRTVMVGFVVGGTLLVASGMIHLLDKNIVGNWLFISGFAVVILPNLIAYIYASWANRA